jgi:tRNA-2-methylthio-N6-dimethylallyladenosine synthase
MNVNDSEKVAGLLLADGYEKAQGAGEADFVFVNTCAVREKASEKLYSALGRLRSNGRPGQRIGVGGCVAQLHGKEILERAGDIDLLVGTHNLSRIPGLLKRTGATAIDLDKKSDAFDVPAAVVEHSNPVRAYVTAIEGCNHVCSFCVVPKTRGTETCRSPEDIVAEVRSIVARGLTEVMLLGQTVNAYRHGTTDFVALLERVHEIDGLDRLRFTTSHPSHVTRQLGRAFADLPKLCPYLHLPVQSGSDAVLKSMRRGYDRKEYLGAVRALREECPSLMLTSDVIVGYPGETLEDFAQTLSLTEEVGFGGLYVFTYSPRPGTTALQLDDDVAQVEKSRRLQVIDQRQQRWQRALNEGRVGQIEEVLVESERQPGRLSGRTRDFRLVHFDGSTERIGRLLDVEIMSAGANSLQGKIVPH